MTHCLKCGEGFLGAPELHVVCDALTGLHCFEYIARECDTCRGITAFKVGRPRRWWEFWK